MNQRFELNVYNEVVCPVCNSTDVLIDVDAETDKRTGIKCICCEKKRTKQQGVVIYQICHGAKRKRGELLKVRTPFGNLIKWLNLRLTFNKNRTNGWLFQLTYTEQFLPSTLFSTK